MYTEIRDQIEAYVKDCARFTEVDKPAYKGIICKN